MERGDRREPAAYEAVRNQTWDDVIELSYSPDFVSGALEALAPVAAHWTLISSVSVYASNSEPNADETAPVVDPVDSSEYGQAKVAAERTAASVVGDRLLIARPGLIGGPGDTSDRFGYWVARFALAGDGPVLTPTTETGSVQVVDVRDLASWILAAGDQALTGSFNVVGDRHGLRDTLEQAMAIAGYTGRTVEATDEWLVKHNVNYWAGPRSLPLWLPQLDSGFSQRSNAAFLEAGGALRSLSDTLTDTFADEQRRGLDRQRRSGLTRGEELALLDSLSR